MTQTQPETFPGSEASEKGAFFNGEQKEIVPKKLWDTKHFLKARDKFDSFVPIWIHKLDDKTDPKKTIDQRLAIQRGLEPGIEHLREKLPKGIVKVGESTYMLHSDSQDTGNPDKNVFYAVTGRGNLSLVTLSQGHIEDGLAQASFEDFLQFYHDIVFETPYWEPVRVVATSE